MTDKLAPSFRRSVVNVLSTWGVQGASVAFALVVVPLVSGRFGVEGLGLWLLIQQVAGHLQLFEMGLNSSLGRFLAKTLARSEFEQHDSYLSSAVVVLCLLAVAVAIMTLALNVFLPALFDVSPALEAQATWMVLVVGGATALSLPLRAGIGVLSSRHRFDLIAISEGLGLVLKIILVLGVCLTDVEPGLVLLAAAVFIPTLVGSAVSFAQGFHIQPKSHVKPGLVSRDSVRALFDVSFSAFLVTAAAVMLRQGSPMILGVQFGIEMIPMLAIPLMVVSVLRPFIAVANKLMSPVASQFDAVGGKAELLAAYGVAARYTLYLAIITFGLVGVFGREVLAVWLGGSGFSGEQLDMLYGMLLIVLGGYCLTLPGAMGRTLLGAVGMHWAAARGEMAGTLVGLLTGAGLLILDSGNPWGMAVGIVVAYVVRAAASAVRLMAVYFELRQRDLYWMIWFRPLGAALPGSAVLLAVTVTDIAGWTRLFGITMAMVLWAWLGLRCLVSDAHARRLRQMFNF